MPKTEKLKLGDELEDVVSKVRGIATGRVEYLDGTIYWIIQPPVGEDSEKPREHYAPDCYCKRIGSGVYPNPNPPVMGFNARNLGG